LQKLEIQGSPRHPMPIDLVFQPLIALTRLQKLSISGVGLEEPESCFPDFKQWPHLAHLSLGVMKVKTIHEILASVPTTQWYKLNLKVIDENMKVTDAQEEPERPGMFEGFEDADWGNLRKLEMDSIDLKIHSDMFRQFHGLTELVVWCVYDEPLFSSQLLEVLSPDIHTHLQVIRCDYPTTNTEMLMFDPWDVKLSSELLAELRLWPNLLEFPSYQSEQCDRERCHWNRIRQTPLTEWATRPLYLGYIL